MKNGLGNYGITTPALGRSPVDETELLSKTGRSFPEFLVLGQGIAESEL